MDKKNSKEIKLQLKKKKQRRVQREKRENERNIKRDKRKEVDKKYKIALCICGFITNSNTVFGSGEDKINIMELQGNKGIELQKLMLRLSYYHIKKHIIDSNPNCEFDIFIHSWSNNVKTDIIDTFKPKKYIIEELITEHNIKYNENGSNGRILSKMLPKLKVTNLLNDYIQENKIIYDQVILTRFDLGLIDNLHIKKYVNKNIKVISSKFGKFEGGINNIFKKDSNWEKNLNRYACSTWLYMSNFENIYNYGQYYNHIIKLINTGKFNPVEMFCANDKASGARGAAFIYDMKIFLDILSEINRYNFITDKKAENDTEIQIIKELKENYNIFMIKLIYFTKSYIKYRNSLTDIEPLLKKYNISEKYLSMGKIYSTCNGYFK
tara:strand:+ start:90 stop:1232 length:1143 start_codon:yes stop_codon:yes gene_type:complete